jgi:Family of unknown function (DUF6338)
MGLIAKDIPTLIFLLLPGFIAAGVFYTLTAHPKTSEFERLIQSLIFTAFVRLGIIMAKPTLFYVGRKWRSYGVWNEDLEFGWSMFLAIAIGLAFAFLAHHDWFHAVMRWCKFTNRTSFPSEWFGAFRKRGRFVVLHLDGERRLRGWPTEWPDQPDKGHFVILEPAWILDNGEESPVYEDDRILVPAVDVKMVEFLKRPNEINVDPDVIKKSRQLLFNAQKKEKRDDGSQIPSATP